MALGFIGHTVGGILRGQQDEESKVTPSDLVQELPLSEPATNVLSSILGSDKDIDGGVAASKLNADLGLGVSPVIGNETKDAIKQAIEKGSLSRAIQAGMGDNPDDFTSGLERQAAAYGAGMVINKINDFDLQAALNSEDGQKILEEIRGTIGKLAEVAQNQLDEFRNTGHVNLESAVSDATEVVKPAVEKTLGLKLNS